MYVGGYESQDYMHPFMFCVGRYGVPLVNAVLVIDLMYSRFTLFACSMILRRRSCAM